jgi:hypothetical protein
LSGIPKIPVVLYLVTHLFHIFVVDIEAEKTLGTLACYHDSDLICNTKISSLITRDVLTVDLSAGIIENYVKVLT